MNSQQLKVIPDIEFIIQESLLRRDSNVILGSKSENSFIKMSESTYQYAAEIVDYLKRGITEEELQLEIAAKYPGQNIDTAAFVEHLKSAGLIQGFEKRFDDEIGLLGITLFKIPFRQKQMQCNVFFRFIYGFFAYYPLWAIPLFVIVTLISFILSGTMWLEHTVSRNALHTALTTAILTVVCFAIHELGHAMTAIRHHVSIREFAVGLYLGIIPTFYFKYRDFKIAPSKMKFKIVLAGVYVNFIAVITSLFLSLQTWVPVTIADIAFQFAILNGIMIVANLFPTRLSDGYYIMSLLINKYDIRLSFWQNLFYTKKKADLRNRRCNLPLLAYSAVILCSIALSLFALIRRAIHYMQQGSTIYGYGILIFFSISIVFAVCKIVFEIWGAKFMTVNLLKKRFRIKRHRKHDFALGFLMMFFCLIISAATFVLDNAQNDALSRYWDKYGSADLLAFYPDTDEHSPDDIAGKASAIANAYIDDSGCAISFKERTEYAVKVVSDLAKLDTLFRIDGIQADENKVCMNTILSEKLGCAVGDTVKIGEESYTVSVITNRVNSFAQDTGIVILHSTKSLETKQVLVAVNVSHSAAAIKAMKETLDRDKILYIDQFSGTQSIFDEFENLRSVLLVLEAAIMLVFLIFLFSHETQTFRSESDWFKTLRMLGISKAKLTTVLLFKDILITLVGSVLGYFAGIGTAAAVCRMTDTAFTLEINLWLLALLLGMNAFITAVVLLISVRKNSACFEVLKSMYDTKKPVSQRKNHLIPAALSVILLAAVILMPVLVQDSFYERETLIIHILLTLCTLICILAVLHEWIPKQSQKIPAESFRLTGMLSKRKVNRQFGLVLSLAVCLVMFCTLTDFSTSFQKWVANKGEQQVSFSARLTAENNTIGKEQVQDLIGQDEVSLAGEYYLAVGKINSVTAYLMSPAAQIQGIADMYEQDAIADLKADEIALSAKLMSDLDLKLGDQATVMLNDVEKKVAVRECFETQDYSSYLVVLSDELYNQMDYSKYCANVSFKEGYTAAELKKYADPGVVKVVSRNELIAEWRSTVTNGVDILLYLSGIMAFALLLVLNNQNINAALDRKHEIALLRILGLSPRGGLSLFVTELSAFHLPEILVTMLFAPIISKDFVELNKLISHYQVEFTPNFPFYLITSTVTLLIMFIGTLKLFRIMRKESPIESFVQY